MTNLAGVTRQYAELRLPLTNAAFCTMEQKPSLERSRLHTYVHPCIHMFGGVSKNSHVSLHERVARVYLLAHRIFTRIVTCLRG